MLNICNAFLFPVIQHVVYQGYILHKYIFLIIWPDRYFLFMIMIENYFRINHFLSHHNQPIHLDLPLDIILPNLGVGFFIYSLLRPVFNQSFHIIPTFSIFLLYLLLLLYLTQPILYPFISYIPMLFQTSIFLLVLKSSWR